MGAEQSSSWTGMEVAVIGMACRFPGAEDVEEFWRNLCAGVESLSRFSAEELIRAGEPASLVELPGYVKVARTISGDDLFDAALFGFSPREAELVDPQQRLFLESSWQALEHAGYDSDRFPGPIGVFGGVKYSTYLWNIYANPALIQAVGDMNAQIANDRDYLATRVSYKLGLRGPSLTVQTACSTSLVAVHLACQALLAGECDMALAGGVSVRTNQTSGYVHRPGDILSPDGRVRAFDAEARGTIFGNGLGVVVLRRLDDALAAGDRIWAVVRGTAVTNDGDLKVGYTAPGADGQERAIRAALGVSGVDPESISYVEAHGTGTEVGDPIEVAALTRAFRASTERKRFCGLGSVKTNIGHLASAAGVAGLIKTALALDRKRLPPTLNYSRPNPQIAFDESPFYVQTELSDWPAERAPRRAGVSAFGIGGTNAHAILEEAPEPAPSGPSRPWQLLVLSAKTETALAAATERLARHLEDRPETPLADVAWTLQVGRRELEHRRAVVCRDRAEAISLLATLDPKRVATRVQTSKNPQVAFLFSGQGAQHAGMFSGLYAAEESFRAEVDRAAEILRPHLGLDLRGLLFPAADAAEPAGRELTATRLAQPALFVVEVALAKLWMEWGIRPVAMLGHSIGEFVAAHLSGVLSLEDALALVAARGRLMQALPAGGMLAVPLSEAEVVPRLGPQLSLAATNGPRRVVVSGPLEAIAALEAELAALGKPARRLHTSHAFHSRMMEPALGAFLAEVSRVELKAPQLPYVSNLTGTWITAAEVTDPGYWVRHLRGTVRFAEGLRTLLAEPERLLLEVGPGQSLTALARQHPDRRPGQAAVASARQPKEETEDQAALLAALGQLWLSGAAVDWPGFSARESRRRAVLPTYPFERRRFWIDPPADFVQALAGPPRAKPFEEWFYVPYWRPATPVLPLGGDAAGPPGLTLVFADDCGLGVQLAERLARGGGAAEGPAVATVVTGRRFSALGGSVYEIDPLRPEDYDELLAALAAEGGPPARIVHCWGVSPDEPPADAARREEQVALGFWSLLYLAQALGRVRLAARTPLAVVATGIESVSGGESLSAEKATALGPCRVIPQEFPLIASWSVDVEWPEGASERAQMVEQVLAEVAAARGEPRVAYRAGRRFAQAWQATPLERTVESRLPFVARGVYLITGGLGGIGLVLAEHLAETFRARLVLTGTTALPPRGEWDAWLAGHGGADRQSERIRKVRRLEELGAEVLALPADVADAEAMRAVVERAHASFGPIRGVIHSAGVAGGGVIQLKTMPAASGVLAPKVRGSRVLEAVLAAEPLDLFVLCSSTIAVFGNLGQVDYCAANNFLDAFARDLSARRGIPALAIDWGAWKEVGMAVNTKTPGLAPGPAPDREAPEGGFDPSAPRLHPLAQTLVSDRPERKVFAARFVPGELWVLDEHRVAKNPTLPGTGHLEMVRAAFAALSGSPRMELRDVLFFQPLIIPTGATREVRLTFEAKGAAWGFKLASRGGSAEGWVEHSTGQVARSETAMATFDLAALAARCAGDGMVVEGRLLGDPDGFVSWGDRWQCLLRVDRNGDEALAELELPSAFSADLDEWHLHPALLDVATAISGVHDGEGSYLPLSYGKLRLAGALPSRFWSYVRRRTEGGGETVVSDISLIDEAGRGVVEIEGFTMKRVGAAAARLKRPEPRPAAPAGKEGRALFAQGGMTSAEGLEAFRRVLAARTGPQIAVSPRDLNAILDQIAALRATSPEDMVKSGPERPAHPRSVETPFVAPRSELERLLAGVWQGVLGIDSVGVDDNFFEMGGDSVLGIQIVARVRDAGLELSTNQLFQHQTVADLAAALGAAPIAPATGASASAASPPFALARLTPEALDRLLAGRAADDAYPLSPLQQGFLFHSLASAGSALYLEQMTADLAGEVDLETLRRAYQFVVDRHPSLRSWYAWEDLERPLQVVAATAELPFAVEDLRALPEGERRARVEAARREDKATPFDLSRAPLMRVRLLRTEDLAYVLLWSHHHLLMDGWSAPMLSAEVRVAYESIRQGGRPQLPPVRPFRDYIEWLEGKDLGAAEGAWRRYLAGLTRPTPLPADRPDDGRPAERADILRLERNLPVELGDLLRAAARSQQVTLNTLVQGGWALLLARASGISDVAFGISVASRPPEIPGVETIVGCFINALPVRSRLVAEAEVGGWLKELHGEQSEMLAYAYTPLVEIQRWSEVPSDVAMFDSILEFWNFPFNVGARWSFEMSNLDYDVATNFPLSLRVIPWEEIVLQVTYDRRRFDEPTVERLIDELAAGLRLLAERPGAIVGEILDELDQRARRARRGRARAISGVAQGKLDKLKKGRRRDADRPEGAA